MGSMVFLKRLQVLSGKLHANLRCGHSVFKQIIVHRCFTDCARERRCFSAMCPSPPREWGFCQNEGILTALSINTGHVSLISLWSSDCWPSSHLMWHAEYVRDNLWLAKSDETQPLSALCARLMPLVEVHESNWLLWPWKMSLWWSWPGDEEPNS